jgi:hypothetical protein
VRLALEIEAAAEAIGDDAVDDMQAKAGAALMAAEGIPEPRI